MSSRVINANGYRLYNLISDWKYIETYVQSENMFCKIERKILFCGFIVNLFLVY